MTHGDIIVLELGSHFETILRKYHFLLISCSQWLGLKNALGHV
eukprot:SAG11_NODE_39987_length_215_cov_4.500000_1_plen_42_part_10